MPIRTVLALVLALTPAPAQEPAPPAQEPVSPAGASASTAFEVLVAPFGADVAAGAHAFAVAGEATFDWRADARFEVGVDEALLPEGGEVTPAELAHLAHDCAERDAARPPGERRLRTFDRHWMLGTQRLAVGGVEGETLVAFAVGSWTVPGDEYYYAAVIRLPRPADSAALRDALSLLRARAIALGDAAVSALRRAEGTQPPEFAGRRGFEPRPLDAPLVNHVAQWPLRSPSDDVLPLHAVAARPGDVVADIGCGNGRHARAMVEVVGPEGRVLGRDPNLRVIERAQRSDDPENLEFQRSLPGDVSIEAETLDRAYLCQVWGIVVHQDTRGALLASLLRAMKPGGEVVVVQYLARGRDRIGFAEQLLAEWTAAGFEPGRRWQLWGRERDGGSPALVFELRRPAR